MLGKACTSIPLRLAKLQCRKAWLVHLLLLGRQVTLHHNASLIRYSFFATFSRMLFFPWRVKLFRYSFFFAIWRDKSYCEQRRAPLPSRAITFSMPQYVSADPAQIIFQNEFSFPVVRLPCALCFQTLLVYVHFARLFLDCVF